MNKYLTTLILVAFSDLYKYANEYFRYLHFPIHANVQILLAFFTCIFRTLYLHFSLLAFSCFLTPHTLHAPRIEPRDRHD